MKLAVTGLRGIPEVMGGVETHCEQLYPLVKQQHPDINITVLGRSPYIGKEAYEYKGLQIKPLWSPKNKYTETIIHTFIAVLFARFILKADAIHIHAIGPALMSPLARLVGLKVVVTHHGEDYNRAKWNVIAKTLLKLGERLAVKSSNHVVVVGKSLTNQLKESYNEHNKISYIPNGMKPLEGANTDAIGVLNELGIEPDKYIVYVGRIVPEKGIKDLLTAYAKSPAQEQGIKLVIVGGSDHEDSFYREMQQLAKRTDGVVMAGVQKSDALYTLFKQSALFVLPSYHEGLPISLLEALSFGCRVLVSDITPNTDVGLPEPCYFPVGNIKSLAQKMSATRLESYSVDGAIYIKKYNWSEISRQFSSTLQGIK